MHPKIHSHPAVTRAYSNVFRIIRVLGILFAFLTPVAALAQAPVAPVEKKKGVTVRMLCVQSLSKAEDDDELILASKGEGEKWTEHGKVTLRSPFITSWLPVPRGTVHLAKRDGEKYTSFGSFLVPEQSERFVIILIPDTSKKIYRAQVLDPANLGFQRGKALFVNYGKVPALVNMGKTRLTVKPGQQVVESIVADQDGMYPLLIGYLDDNKNVVPCYDKRVSSNPKTRKFILLFPNGDLGLSAMSLSEFGPFE